MGSLSLWHVVIVLIICLFFFGPRRLPDLGNSLGKAIRGFKKGLREAAEDDDGEEREYEEREALPPARTPKKPNSKSKKKSQS